MGIQGRDLLRLRRHNYEQYVILYYIVGPTCRGPNGHVRVPLKYKREALAVHGETTHKLSQTLSRQGNTTHSGRRVLRSGGPNHSNPAVFIVFLSEIELVTSYPRVLTLWA